MDPYQLALSNQIPTYIEDIQMFLCCKSSKSGLSWRFRKKFFERSKNETFACSLANLRISSSANWLTGPLLSWFSILGIIETRRRWAPGVSLMHSTTCLTNLIKFETYHCSHRKLLEPLEMVVLKWSINFFNDEYNPCLKHRKLPARYID